MAIKKTAAAAKVRVTVAAHKHRDKRSNKKLAATMASHLITDLAAFGIWENDFDKFLDARGRVVLQELNMRLAPEFD